MKKLMLAAMLACLGLPALGAEEGNPPPGRGKGLRGAIRERIAEKFDKDGDGQLSAEERQAARQALVDRIMTQFDKDGDGKLSREELSAALIALRHRLQAVRERAPRGGQVLRR